VGNPGLRPVVVLSRLGALATLAMAASAAGSDAPADAAVDALRQRILAHAALQPGMVVAEIGVGHGWFVFRAAEAVGSKGTVYGTDIDRDAIAALQAQLPQINPNAGHVDLRLCRDPRDTALDDLPDGAVDVVLMVDSLCFDASEPRERNIAYLRRFLRVLRPGGRLIHHMDCLCGAMPDAVVAQFREAGFAPSVESVDVGDDIASADPNWRCASAEARTRHAFVAVFRKPAASSVQGAPTP